MVCSRLLPKFCGVKAAAVVSAANGKGALFIPEVELDVRRLGVTNGIRKCFPSDIEHLISDLFPQD
jgi:hypothetical protein